MDRLAPHSGPSATARPLDPPPGLALAERFVEVRARTRALAAPLEPEDMVVQSMPDVSPTKWHLAHTSWFFEAFVLDGTAGFERFDPAYEYLFNSYYEHVGERHPRPRRGLLTRPTVAETLAYREHVEAAVLAWLAAADPVRDADRLAALALGLQHEEQHQELLLTDALHVLACNPLRPAYDGARRRPRGPAPDLAWVAFDEGLTSIGHDGHGFAFDNEGPRHRQLVPACELANRPVTCGEFLAFVEDGGYATSTLWLSDGWAAVQAGDWQAPAYWRRTADGSWTVFGLAGEEPLDPHEPVAQLSLYEADAFARWAGARLPTEAEWERAAAPLAPHASQGRFVQDGWLQPVSAHGLQGELLQLYGDVWEWTSSAYAAYPGYRPAAGALGEYNGKFMCNQVVLRGGSCATPRGHVRATYRNFFPADARWQFSGLRLARDRA